MRKAATPARAGEAAPGPTRRPPASARPGRFALGVSTAPAVTPPRVQAKLEVGPVDDEYEREADQVSEQVMRMPDPAAQEDDEELAPAIVVQQRTGVSPSRIQRDEVEIDLEVPPPAERAELRDRGVDLPQVSAASADPRGHSDYIDRRLNAVGFGIYLGGYMVYCTDLPLPIFVPDSHIDFGATSVGTDDPSIYGDRESALAAVPYGPPALGQPTRNATFYRGAGGAVIAPTLFSPATTPRFISTALQAQRALAEAVQHELVVLAVSLVGGMVLRAILNRIARIGMGGPEPPPRALVPPGTGSAFGRQMATEMRAVGFRGNPFREFIRRLNARPQRLPPQEAAEAIEVATREFSGGTMGTMPPVQHGNVLVVPSRAPIPNAPVVGIRADGTVVMGRAGGIEIVRNAQGVPVMPPQARIVGDITWE
jgi:hypothetical protein